MQIRDNQKGILPIRVFPFSWIRDGCHLLYKDTCISSAQNRHHLWITILFPLGANRTSESSSTPCHGLPFSFIWRWHSLSLPVFPARWKPQDLERKLTARRTCHPSYPWGRDICHHPRQWSFSVFMITSESLQEEDHKKAKCLLMAGYGGAC